MTYRAHSDSHLSSVKCAWSSDANEEPLPLHKSLCIFFCGFEPVTQEKLVLASSVRKNICSFSGNGLRVGGPFLLRSAVRNDRFGCLEAHAHQVLCLNCYEWPLSLPASQRHIRSKNRQEVFLCVNLRTSKPKVSSCPWFFAGDSAPILQGDSVRRDTVKVLSNSPESIQKQPALWPEIF